MEDRKIEEIPTEIRVKILLDSDYNDMMNLCNTNKSMRHICNDDSFWRLKYIRDFGPIGEDFTSETENFDSWRNEYLRTMILLSFQFRRLDLRICQSQSKPDGYKICKGRNDDMYYEKLCRNPSLFRRGDSDRLCGSRQFWKNKLRRDFGQKFPEVFNITSEFKVNYYRYYAKVLDYFYDAILNGNIEEVKEYLEFGYFFEGARTHHNTFIVDAAKKSKHEILELLLYWETEVENRKSSASGALSDAAENGDLKGVNILLEYGADPNYRPRYGYDLLASAIRGGNIEIVRKFLDLGADPYSDDVSKVLKDAPRDIYLLIRSERRRQYPRTIM